MGICPHTARMTDDYPCAETTCCATALRKASRRLSQLYDDALAEAGLRGTQLSILAELHARGDAPSIAELAEALVTDRSALGHNLRPLERDGLVEIVAGEHDKRRRDVLLTARGRAKVREALPLWRNAQERFLAAFGARNAAQLRATLLAIAYDERLGKLT